MRAIFKKSAFFYAIILIILTILFFITFYQVEKIDYDNLIEDSFAENLYYFYYDIFFLLITILFVFALFILILSIKESLGEYNFKTLIAMTASVIICFTQSFSFKFKVSISLN